MRKPEITIPNISLSRESLPKIAGGVGIGALSFIGLMSVIPVFHRLFEWVPVSNSNIVLDSALKFVVGILLIGVAVAVVLPISMALHTIGHAVGGHFMGLRVLAVRVGPILFSPLSPSNRFERLPISSKTDALIGWAQFDDSPIAT